MLYKLTPIYAGKTIVSLYIHVFERGQWEIVCAGHPDILAELPRKVWHKVMRTLFSKPSHWVYHDYR